MVCDRLVGRAVRLKIVIAGGTGQLGSMLARTRHGAGDEVVVFSRAPSAAPWRVVAWDGRSSGPWEAELDGADVVVNLAGRSVNCRYTPANRAAILESRVDATRALGAAIARAARPPRVWLQSSTATIYAHRFDADNDEDGIIGGGPDAPDTWRFSVDVATAWERAAQEAQVPQTRLVLLRSAMVMSADRGGVFDTMLTLVRRGLGGPAGSGRQYVSWIHGHDWLAALDLLVADDAIRGAVNLAAPQPLPYAAFMRALRAAWGIPIGLPAPGPLLEFGALLMGTETELVLKSRRVVPKRLLAHGFHFDFPEWPAAARDLCAQVRAR